MSPSTVEVTSSRLIPRAAAMLARPAVRQAAMACSRNSTGVGPVSLPEHGRMVGVIDVLPLVPHLLHRPGEAVDGAAAVRAAHPPVAGAELKRGDLRLPLDRVQGGEQGRDVHAVA